MGTADEHLQFKPIAEDELFRDRGSRVSKGARVGTLLALIKKYGRVILPSEGLSPRYNARKLLEAAGVVFFEEVPDAPLLRFVKLPMGWQAGINRSPFWTAIIDAKGRVRASAFYDAQVRSTCVDLCVLLRYNVQQDFALLASKGVAVAYVTDCGRVIHATPGVSVPRLEETMHDRAGGVVGEAIAWLEERYPDWRNPSAYWEE